MTAAGNPGRPTPWQLVLARVVSVFMALCHAAALVALVVAYTLVPVRPASSFTGLAVINVVSACIAFWTMRTVFKTPRAAIVGFQALLGLLVVALALLPATYPGAQAGLLWFAAATTAIQGVVMYGVPLALLVVLRRRGQLS